MILAYFATPSAAGDSEGLHAREATNGRGLGISGAVISWQPLQPTFFHSISWPH